MKAISKRMAQVTGSVTLAIDNKAKAMKQAGEDVISFGAGEPDYDTPAHIVDAAIAAMHNGQTRYTPARGTAAICQAVCDKLKRRNGLSYQPNQIIVTNGAKQALHNAFCALLDEGDEAILLAPCWVSYAELIMMAGGTPVLVQRKKEQGFALDLAALEAAITERTKAIVINTPDNPTGTILKTEELAAIAALAQRHDLYIIADEIYEDFAYVGATPPSIATLNDDAYARTLLINGVSKTYAMTGWRLGYLACAASIAEKISDWQSHATGNVNSITQQAAITALNGEQGSALAMVAEFARRRLVMAERINAMPYVSCHVPDGAFYIMMDIIDAIGLKANGQIIEDDMDFAQLLLEQAGVAVVPGSAFFASNMVRFSYALSMADLVRGMDKMEAFLKGLQG